MNESCDCYTYIIIAITLTYGATGNSLNSVGIAPGRNVVRKALGSSK